MRYRIRMQLLLLTLSAILGAAGTFLFAERLPVCSPAPMAHMAWWGGVYPEYCLPGAMEAVEEEEEDLQEEESEIQVRVRFKYLTFLNG